VTLTFHPAARNEFVAAAEYYEAAVSGLGGRFQAPFNAPRRSRSHIQRRAVSG